MTKQQIQDRIVALCDKDPSNATRLLGLMVAAAPAAATRMVAMLEGWQAREEERAA